MVRNSRYNPSKALALGKISVFFSFKTYLKKVKMIKIIIK